MNRVLRFLADLVYPARCPVCGDFVMWDELVCEKCETMLPKTDESVCPYCGKPECICKSVCYDRAYAAFFYSGAAAEGIYSLKDGSKEFGVYLGRRLGEMLRASGEVDIDAIVPVPMSDEKRRKRGYNQSEVIAAEIAEILGIKLEKNVLYKTVGAPEQHSLSRRMRKENVSAFGASECRLDGMKILLCDDVLTTGSTMSRCAELLKAKGAAEVYAAVGTTTKLKKGIDENGTGYRN